MTRMTFAHRFPPPPGTPMGDLAAGAADMAISATHRAIRILLRLATAGALATVGGIAVGAMATDGGFLQLLVTFVAAIALWIPAFILLSGIAGWRRGRAERVWQLEEQRRLAPVGGQSWVQLRSLAGYRAEEVHALCSQLASTREQLPTQSLDPQVHELRILIEKRIPQLIDSGLACLPADPRERTEATNELIDLVGRFAADCRERERQVAHGHHAEHQALRRRIEDHLTDDSPRLH
ncbi:hypothetical protein ACFQPG_04090 [Sphingomonas sp. GCM10030256]|uniref:hypothetical protein n=1 Tax=Sphingomonas sp. GCM10030256 TaxID=3273427 RepID=UPI0036229A31